MANVTVSLRAGSNNPPQNLPAEDRDTVDWSKVTNKPSVLAGSGLSGGGQLTSDVTLSLTPGSIGNTSLATMPTVTIKGNATGGTTAPQDLTAAQVAAMLPNVVGDSGSGGTKGLVPAATAGDAAALKFLSASGSFTTVGSQFLGSSPWPAVVSQITTTGNINGTTTLTLSSAVAASNGDTIIASGIPGGTRIVSGAGTTTIIMSRAATTTATGITVLIGNSRWSSSYTGATTVGAKNLYVGSAAQGRSTWLNQVGAAGLDYSEVSSAVFINPNGGSAVVVGARMSDENTGLTAILPLQNFVYVDTNASNKRSWNYYEQAKLASGATGYHISEESSIQSYWTAVDVDPYDYNDLGSTTVKRLDSGIGTYAGGSGYETQPNNISSYIQCINNDAGARTGILFGDNSLDTTASRIPPALAMPTNYSITWYRSAATESWRFYSKKTSGTRYDLVLSDDGVAMSGPAGSGKNLYFQTSLGNRWSFGSTSTAESGSNAGSDFAIARFDDSNAYLSIPFQIIRSTGRIKLDVAAMTTYANDAAAAAGGVQVGELYRNGSVIQIRVS